MTTFIRWLLLITAVLGMTGAAACSRAAPTADPIAPPVDGPALLFFYTDN